jgi:hypothetical protein
VVKNGYCGIGITPDVTPEDHFRLCGVNVNFPTMFIIRSKTRYFPAAVIAGKMRRRGAIHRE